MLSGCSRSLQLLLPLVRLLRIPLLQLLRLLLLPLLQLLLQPLLPLLQLLRLLLLPLLQLLRLLLLRTPCVLLSHGSAKSVRLLGRSRQPLPLDRL